MKIIEKISKFCGNVVCHSCSLKRRHSPINSQKTLRICAECENKYLGKRNYDEFLTKKKVFDVRMEHLTFQYDLFDEGLKNMQKTVFDMDFDVFKIFFDFPLNFVKKKKSMRDTNEIIIEKKKLMEKVIENSLDNEEKTNKLTAEITNINKKINIIKKEINDFDNKNQEL